MSTQQRTEQQTIQFLLQLDDGQAVDAGNGGEFAAAMNVMFEHMPDDPLERDCHLSLSRRSQPHYQQRIERGDQHLNGRYRSMLVVNIGKPADEITRARDASVKIPAARQSCPFRARVAHPCELSNSAES